MDGGTVSVTGPRVGVLVYRLWLALQLVILALCIPAILAVLGLRDWRYLLLVPVLLILHWFVGVVGAAGLWELANMTAIGTGHPTHTFPIGSVKRVRIGPGVGEKRAVAGHIALCGWDQQDVGRTGRVL
jgi:hypothetical protein